MRDNRLHMRSEESEGYSIRSCVVHGHVSCGIALERFPMIVLLAIVLFLAGIAVGLLIAEFYPKHDAAFKEYLRREYGQKKE